jgi:hypothetical protein
MLGDRGQTEVLGYVLVFGIIILSIAVITGPGQTGLQDTRAAQQTANIEGGFRVLAANVEDVTQGGVPSRATEFDLAGERVGLGPTTTVQVNATYAANGTVAFNRTARIRPLLYQSPNGGQLAYSNGAVLAQGDDDGVAMVRRPTLLNTSERTIIPVVNTSLDRGQLRSPDAAVDRESRVLVRTERRGPRNITSVDANVTVTITITSPRAPAWQRHLTERLDATCTTSGSTVSCSYPASEATVIITHIDVSLE